MWSTFDEYKKDTFEFEGRTAEVVFPENPEPARRWAIYTEYFGAFPVVAQELLRRGWHIARLNNIHRWGCREDQECRLRYADYLEKQYGLAHRCVPIGMSCGGLHAVKFAAYCPDRISALYLDAPLLNLLSYPMCYGREGRVESVVEECLNALQMTERQMLSYRDHPLDRIEEVVKAHIPAALVYGDADPVVPFEDNGAILAEEYRKADVPIWLLGKHGCEHHPHGPVDAETLNELADFLTRWE